MLKMRILIIGCILSVFTMSAGAWTETSTRAITNDAKKLMPVNLQKIFQRHNQDFISGHRQKPPTGKSREELIAIILKEADAVINLISKQNAFSEASRRMGRISRIITVLNTPLDSHVLLKNEFWRTDYDIFLQKNQKDFRVRWYGIQSRPRSIEQLETLLRSSAEKMKKVAGILTKTLEKEGKPISSYDVRSVPFGVGSISYSNAVSNIAMSWLYIWDRSGGVRSDAKSGAKTAVIPATVSQ